MPPVLINLLLFQIAWWAAVLSGADILPDAAALAAILPLADRLLRASDRPLLLLRFGTAAGLGFALDCLLAARGVVAFPPEPIVLGPCPIWMLSLWVAFVTTLDAGLCPLRGRPVLAVLLGVVAAPPAYLAAAALGALTLPLSVAAWPAIGLGWGALLPVLLWVVVRRSPGQVSRDHGAEAHA